jgi:hypothetical protein
MSLKSIKEVLTENDPTPWTGSEKTYELVKAQIAERWGQKVANSFSAKRGDVRTFRAWLARKFVVNKSEHGLESFVIIEKKNDRGETIKKVPKRIWLFHRKQVSKLK